MSTIKPIFLLADSQLLFWRDQGELFLSRVRALLDFDGTKTAGGTGEAGAAGAARAAAEAGAAGAAAGTGAAGAAGAAGGAGVTETDATAEAAGTAGAAGVARAASSGRSPRAAYLGASNGDAPEFYQLFVAAMEQIDIRDCRQIPSQPAAEDLAFLAAADLILLAGGDVRRGWDAFKAAGLDQKLVERYYGGALLIGISAGAVQLGLKGWDESGERSSDMLRVVPFVVDVHDEPGWGRLLQAVPRAGEHARGFGIPSGGGAVYHPDYSVEPVRHPLVEVSQTESGLHQSLLLPGEGAATAAPAAPPSAAASGDRGQEPEQDQERRELGYSIGADGVIELRRPQDSPPEPVN